MHAALTALCRLTMAAFLLLAAISKLSNPQFFVTGIQGFKIIPDQESWDKVTIALTFVVPWTEAVCGILLFLGLWTRAAATISILLLAGFTAALISVIQRGLNVSCGCFGDIDLFCGEKVSWCNVWRNAAFAAITAIPLIRGSGELGLDALPRGTPEPERV